VRVAEDEAIHAIVKKRGYARKNRGDGRQAASHGLRDRQAEGIFKTGTDIEIGGGIKIENILARGFKTAALQNAKRSCSFPERIRRIVPGREHHNWQFSKSTHSAEHSAESFDSPIVSDQEQHEIGFLKAAAAACFIAQREPGGRRKLRRVNAIGNDADILPVKIIG